VSVPVPAEPVPGPASLPGVKRRLPQGGRDVDDAALQDIVDAVNVRVSQWHRDSVPADGNGWPADLMLGANMLASRLWTRRQSPAGVMAPAGDATAPTYIVRNDPDVALLLRLGPYATPRVG